MKTATFRDRTDRFDATAPLKVDSTPTKPKAGARTQHTPIEFRFPNCDSTFAFAAYKDGKQIWNDNANMPQELRELIAAAPSLLAFVKAIAEDPNLLTPEEWASDARAEIAKCEGKGGAK